MAAHAHSEAVLRSPDMSSRGPSSRAIVAKKKHESMKREKPWSHDLRPPYWFSCLIRKVRALKTWYGVGNAPISASKHLGDEMVSMEPYFSLPVVQATVY